MTDRWVTEEKSFCLNNDPTCRLLISTLDFPHNYTAALSLKGQRNSSQVATKQGEGETVPRL